MVRTGAKVLFLLLHFAPARLPTKLEALWAKPLLTSPHLEPAVGPALAQLTLVARQISFVRATQVDENDGQADKTDTEGDIVRYDHHYTCVTGRP